MKGVFKCAREDDKKIQEGQTLKLGDAPMHPQEIFKKTQASKLGDAPVGIPPFFINNYRLVSVDLKFLLLHMICAILAMSFLFCFACCLNKIPRSKILK